MSMCSLPLCFILGLDGLCHAGLLVESVGHLLIGRDSALFALHWVMGGDSVLFAVKARMGDMH